MFVSRMQGQIVLQDERRQPHVIRGNRRTLLPELAKDGCVVVSRLIVCKEDTHAVFQEETSQDSFVFGLPTTMREAGPKLADHDEWQQDRLGFLQERYGPCDSFAQVDVSIRIESNPHRQRSSSTRS